MAKDGAPKRETWREWLPPARVDPRPLLTRAQLVERLRADGVQVEEADLRYWEYEGILPRAVRQRHEGATRAVYPIWFADLVQHLRTLQGGGYELREIARMLRDIVAGQRPPWITLHPHFWRQASSGMGVAVPPSELSAPLMELARRTRHIHGEGAVKRGEIRFYGDEDAEPIVYAFTVGDEAEHEG